MVSQLAFIERRADGPDHPLGDFPANKWRQLASHIPANLTGWSAVDIGCNAGFYSFELVRRVSLVWRNGSPSNRCRFMNWHVSMKPMISSGSWVVFYHLRYPFLALNIVARKVQRLMVSRPSLCRAN